MSHHPLAAPLARILQVEPDHLDEALLARAGVWDSLETLATIAVLDEEHGVTVPASELTSCTSLAAILALVDRAKAAGPDVPGSEAQR